MAKLNFAVFPRIETEHIVLRQLEESDSKEIFLLRSDVRVNRYLDRVRYNNVNEASEFIAKINDGIRQDKWMYWAIAVQESSKLGGTICLWNFSDDNTIGELGYELLPALQGKGIMNKALREVVEFGFCSIGLQVIEAYTHKDNVQSTKLLVRNNFRQDTHRGDEKDTNNLIFTLSKQYWKRALSCLHVVLLVQLPEIYVKWFT